MTVNKFGDDSFVNAADSQLPLTNPLRKMGNATYALAKRGRGVTAVCQVLLVGINVGREWPGGKPVDAGRCSFVSHGGLLV